MPRRRILYHSLREYIMQYCRFLFENQIHYGRVETRGEAAKVRCVAFKSAEGGMVVEVMNSGSDPARIRIKWHDKTVPVTLPAQSISTLAWQG